MICYMLIMIMPLWITVYLRNKWCLNLESWIVTQWLENHQIDKTMAWRNDLKTIKLMVFKSLRHAMETLSRVTGSLLG